MATLFGVAAILAGLCGCRGGPPKIKPAPVTLVIEAAGRASELTIPVYVAPYTDSVVLRKGADPRAKDAAQDVLKPPPGKGVDRFMLSSTPKTYDRKKDSRQWQEWIQTCRGNHLLVVADLPKSIAGEGTHYVVVPLAKAEWTHLRGNPVRVQIREDAVKLLD